MIQFKVCKLCKEELSIDKFWKNPTIKDGFFNKCKVCANKTKDINALAKQKYLESNLWTCSSCNITLPLTSENFHRRNDSATGFQNRCKKCLRKDPARCNRLIKKDDLSMFLKDRFYGARSRAIKKHIEFNIDLEYLDELWKLQQGLCAITKIKMTHSILQGKLKTNLSIDKINPSLGYTKDNIQLVCNIINVMKSDMSMNDLKYFCKLIIQQNE
jgi:hypothetical protein